MPRFVLVALGAAALVSACSGRSNGGRSLPLRHVADVAMPGRPTRFDYTDVDPARHLLVVAHLGDSQVVAVDLERRQVRWTAGNLSSVHGIRVVPALERVFATATGTNEVVAIDESNGRELGRARTGRFPDGVAYEAADNRVLVSDRDGGSVTVVDAATFAPVGRIAVGGDIGNVQTSTSGAFAAVGASSQLVQVDSALLRVTRRLELPGCSGAHGVAVDPSRSRVYIACEDNAALVAVDLTSGTVLATWRVGDQPDVLALDPAGHRLYVAAESGTVTVVALDGLTLLGRAHYAPGAHTVAVDPQLGLVAFPLAEVHGHPSLRLASPTMGG